MELITKEEAKFWRFFAMASDLKTKSIESALSKLSLTYPNNQLEQMSSKLDPQTILHLSNSSSRPNDRRRFKNSRSLNNSHNSQNYQDTAEMPNNFKRHQKYNNSPKSLPYSSFLLAEEFLHEIENMDLISTADTLKKLVHLALEFNSNKNKNFKNSSSSYNSNKNNSSKSSSSHNFWGGVNLGHLLIFILGNKFKIIYNKFFIY